MLCPYCQLMCLSASVRLGEIQVSVIMLKDIPDYTVEVGSVLN